jgi:hypothetical protein
MKFEVIPYGKEYRFDQVSDIVEIIFTKTGLRVTVVAATSMFTDIYLDIHFANCNAFRFLEDGDLIAYWESESFKSNHHIYEILSGGWSNGDFLELGILSITSELGIREWFIATTNGCMTILSGEEPQVREFTNTSISS